MTLLGPSAQMELVARAIRSPSVMKELAGVLDQKHLASPNLGHVWAAAVAEWNKWGDRISEAQLRQGLDHVNGIQETISQVCECDPCPKGQAVQWGRELAAYAHLMSLDLPQMCRQGMWKEMVDEARRAERLAAPSGNVVQGGGTTQDILNRQSVTRSGIPTGWGPIDLLLDGGVWNGHTAHVVGPKGGGKTHTLTDRGATGLELGKVTFHATAEWNRENTLAGYDRRLSGKTKDELRLCEGNGTLASILEAEQRLHIMDNTGSRMTVASIEAEMEKLKDPPDLVIIDYANRMTDGRKASEDWQRLNNVSEQVRMLAQRWHIPVWIGFQASSEGIRQRDAGGVITEAHYAEAVYASWHAAVVITLNQTVAESKSRAGRLYLAQSWQGESRKVVDATFDWSVSKVVADG